MVVQIRFIDLDMDNENFIGICNLSDLSTLRDLAESLFFRRSMYESARTRVSLYVK